MGSASIGRRRIDERALVRPIFAAFLLALGSLPSQTATAEEPPKSDAADPARKRALELFHQSEERFNVGDYTKALELLEEAYATKPVPVLLYNMARSYENLGEMQKAIDAYGRFMAAAPSDPDLPGIKERIKTLRRLLRERDEIKERYEHDLAALRAKQAEELKRPPPPPPPSQLPPGLMVGAGVVALGAGVAFSIAALSKHKSAADEAVQTVSAEKDREAHTLATLANVTLIGGGAVAAAGALWLWLGARPGKPIQPKSFALRPRVSPLWVGLSGSF